MQKLIAALAVLALATPAAAQSIDERMATLEAMVAVDGMDVAAGPFHGGLGDEATERFSFPLVGGANFVVAAVCDNACANLDLKAYAADGTLLEHDLGPNNMPGLQLSSDLSLIVTVEVIMSTCGTARCAWRAKVWYY